MSSRWSTEYHYPLGAYAEKQPYVKRQYKQERQALNRQLQPCFRVDSDGLEYDLNSAVTTNTARFKQLKKIIYKNRQRGLPLAGFYNLDIPKLAKNGTFTFVIEPTCIASEQDLKRQNYPFDDGAQQKAVEATVKGMNFSGFWDGTYYFRFPDPYSEENITRDVKAVIKNGQVETVKKVELQ